MKSRLAEWYEKNKRALPWRATSDPYFIWISEVILQQTRVDQGTAYYHRFIERFPNVTSLAAAEEDEVLKLWQGLGYYSRARNLHAAAKQIVNEHGGRFPDDYDRIRSLKGVGPYTAAAISSIAFGIPVAVVDGNVARVISRLFAVEMPVNKAPGMKAIEQLAAELLDVSNPSRHNQAMMEFGALQCTPSNPACGHCPLAEICEGREKGMVSELPRKEKNIKRRSRYFHYVIVTDEKGVGVQQRTQKDIWQGLFEFLLVEKSANEELTNNDLKGFGLENAALLRTNEASKHVLSHQDIHGHFHHYAAEQRPDTIHFVPIEDFSNLALPRLIERYLEQYALKTGEKT